MNNRSTIDRFHSVLFSNSDEILLSAEEKKIIIRYRAVYTLSLETPWVTDTEIRDFLMNEFNIGQTQAYHDIGIVRILLGKVQNAGKGWIRYIVNESLKKHLDDAHKMGKAGMKLGIMAAGYLGKFNMLDKEDSIELPWEDIIPQSIEPTTDPTVLGIKPMENKSETIRRMYEKYKDEIEDADYVVIDNER